MRENAWTLADENARTPTSALLVALQGASCLAGQTFVSGCEVLHGQSELTKKSANYENPRSYKLRGFLFVVVWTV